MTIKLKKIRLILTHLLSMKYFILLFLLISFENYSFARSQVLLEQYVENGVIKTRKKTLEGIGPSFIEKVKISEDLDPVTNVKSRKVTVFVRNCKDVEVTGNKASELKNGDAIKFRLGSVDSCNIQSWEKYQF